jgi:predicted GNAT family acetyltransferase
LTGSSDRLPGQAVDRGRGQSATGALRDPRRRGLAGAIYYELQGDTIAVDHTEVDQRFEGQGLGSQLARQALDDMRRRGLRVLPFCAFVRSYIARHGEYLDLVPEKQRAAFGL